MKTIVKMLTLNLWGKNEPFSERMTILSQFIEQYGFDIIGFQEYYTFNKKHPLQQALKKLNYHILFKPTFQFSNSLNEFGNAIATRTNEKAHGTIVLPGKKDDEPRNAAYLIAEINKKRICFVSTHLNWEPSDGLTRKIQIKHLIESTNKLALKFNAIPIIVGDFNAEPDSDEIKYLLHSNKKKESYFKFHDVWKMKNPNQHFNKFTIDIENPFVSSQKNKKKRIDYIFIGTIGEIEQSEIVINSCNIEKCNNHRGEYASDHYGISISIEFKSIEG